MMTQELKTFCLAAGILQASFVPMLPGQNLVPGGDFVDSLAVENWEPRGELYSDDKNSGEYSMKIASKESGWIVSSDFIEIDPEAFYRFRAYLKSAPGEQRIGEILFGLNYYDNEQRLLRSEFVQPVEGSEAVLAADANPEDTVLTVRKNDWSGAPPDVFVAFDAKEDYSDLPNFSAVPVESVTMEEGAMKVRLMRPLKEYYSTGAAVRLQQGYVRTPGRISVKLNEYWQEVETIIGGESLPGITENDRFWHGTKYVRASIFVLSGPEVKQLELLIDDVSLVKE